MDEEELITKLTSLSSSRLKNSEENETFQNFVENLDFTQLSSLVKSRLSSPDGPHIISTIFHGLSMKNASQKKRLKLFELLLSEFHEKEIPSRNVSSILLWLVFQVDKLSSTHLVRVCDLCVDYASKSTNENQTSWKDLLPKILTVLISKDEIDHYGNEMTGEAYKNQVVTALCQASWSTAILPSIAAMFVYIPLNNEEHAKVTTKLCSCLHDLSPEEIPPFTHQLLNLTKHQNAISVFFALKKYFNKHIYHLDDSSGILDSDKEALTQPQNSSDIEVSTKEVTESQAMVLYYFEQAAKRSLSCASELVKMAKACIPCAEIMFDPFTLSLLLNISNISTYEIEVIDILKSMMTRLVIQEQKRNDSDWLRKVLNTNCDVEVVLTKLIRGGACELEGVVVGLVNLSMNLLKVGVKTDKISKIVSRFGRMIAVNIVIKCSPAAETLLESIATNIMASPEVTQYTDCLGELCENCPMLIVENMRVVNHLLEVLPQLPEGAANRVVYALVSLLKFSSRLRDNLILILRKSLFMQNIGSRKVAVSGFLHLLKTLKIRGMNSLSQNSFQAYSCPSVFTQTVISVHTQNLSTSAGGSNNEGLCLEVINILKQCFTQQLPIKISLYSGLQRALIKNPELCIPITDMFLDHLGGSYFKVNEEELPPLDFDKAININQNDEVVVNEPLGHLVFIVQQILITSDQLIAPVIDDDHYQTSRLKLYKIMDSLVTRFSRCDLRNFEFDEEGSTATENKLKEERLRHCINVYQALTAYLISKWDVTCTIDDVKTLMGLFRAHSHFEDFAKKQKPAKKEEASQKKRAKDTTLIIPGKKQFVFNETVMDFNTIQRMLSLVLCESVDWCLDDVAKELKSKKALHRFAIHSTVEVLQKTKTKLSIQKSKPILDHLMQTAKLLFGNIVNQFDTAMAFDPTTAILGVEAFLECCTLAFTYYRRQINKFLSEASGASVDDGLDKLLEVVIKPILKNLSKALECIEEGDPNAKSLITILVNGLHILAPELPPSGLCINKVFRWLTDFAETKTLSSGPNVKTLIALLLTLLAKCKSEATLHDNLSLQLCRLFGSINEEELETGTVNLALVDDANKCAVLQLLCQSLNSRLDVVDWVIIRVKSELALISQPDALQTEPQSRRAVLKRKEKDLVTELGLIVSASQWICTSSMPQSCAETTCKLFLHIYSSLTLFTKYFMARGAGAYQEARFGKLVKLAASNLSTQVADFLLYIETIDNEDVSQKKVSMKTLRLAEKQTIYIPKLVAELENFTKCVTQLSTKSKDPTLMANVKLTTTRDFRLNTKKLEEIMKNREEEDSSDSADETTQRSVAGESVPSQLGGSQERPSTSTASQSKKRKHSTESNKSTGSQKGSQKAASEKTTSQKSASQKTASQKPTSQKSASQKTASQRTKQRKTK